MTPDLSRRRLLSMSRATPDEREQLIRAAAGPGVATVADTSTAAQALVAELERRLEQRRIWLARS
jgi:hypothetical protein